jgi:hypothetical protein
VQNGELDGLHPKLVVIEIGYENLLQKQKPEDVVAGIHLVIDEYRKACPDAHIALTSIYPQHRENIPTLAQTNALLAGLADGQNVTYIDLGPKILGPPDPSLDQEHYTQAVYETWEDELQPLLERYIPSSDVGRPRES